MPESVTDRCTKAHEYLFLLTRSERYYYDRHAIKERSVCPDDSTPEDIARAMNRRRHRAVNCRQDEVRIPAGWDTSSGGHRGKDGHFTHKKRTVRPGVDTHGGNQGNGKIAWNCFYRNKRDVWTVASQPFSGPHYATYPQKLIEPCILAGSPVDGVVLDPFSGSGTTGVVALKHGRRFVGIELNPRDVRQFICPRLKEAQEAVYHAR